jgi:hypothetical protein
LAGSSTPIVSSRTKIAAARLYRLPSDAGFCFACAFDFAISSSMGFDGDQLTRQPAILKAESGVKSATFCRGRGRVTYHRPRRASTEILTYGFDAKSFQAALGHGNIKSTKRCVAASVETAKVALAKVGRGALGKRTG